MTHVSNLVDAAYALIKERYETQDFVTGIPTGFSRIDSMTGGLHRKELVVVAGRPSMGVTKLCLNLALNVGVDLAVPVLIFSLEESKEQTLQHMLCILAEVNVDRLRVRTMKDSDWKRVENAMEKLSRAPIYIEDQMLMSDSDMIESCNKIKISANGLGLVIVDPVELMGSKSDDDDIGANVHQLKKVAEELDVALIAAGLNLPFRKQPISFSNRCAHGLLHLMPVETFPYPPCRKAV